MKQVELKIASFKDLKRVLVSNIPLFLIVAVLAIITFINGVNGEFVSDDIPGIVNHPDVINLGNAFKSGNLQVMLQGTIYSVFGANEVPFHLFSLFLHIVNLVLFFFIIYNIFSKKIAAIAMVLYAVHPLISESLLWISAVNYLLSTFFLYVCTLLYLMYKKNQDRRYLITVFLLFAFLGVFFPNFWVLIIPLLIAGIDFFLLKTKISLKPLLKLSPLFIISIVVFLYIGFFQSEISVSERIESLDTPEATPFLNRLPYSIYMVGELLIYPKNLTLYHEGEMISTFKYQAMTVIAILVILGLIYLWKKPKYRIVAGLITLIFISVLPVFSPLQVAWFAAERYLYVAAGFFTTLLAMLFLKLDRKWKGKNLAIILTVLLTVVYSGRSIARTFDWKTRKSVWLSTAKVSPYSARVHNNLGDVYGIENDWQRSIQHFETAIQLKPDYSEAMHNLGNTYMRMGQLETARELLLASLKINPALFQSLHKLGLVEYNLGNPETAEKYFVKSIEVNPNYLPAVQALQTLRQRTQ